MASVAIIFLVLLAQTCNGYRILMTNLGISGSQNLIMYRYADMLSASPTGNKVTILHQVFLPDAKVPTISPDVDIIKVPSPLGQEDLDFLKQKQNDALWTSKSYDQLATFFPYLLSNCDFLLGDQNLYHKLKLGKFDVAVIHLIDFCGLALAHKLGIEARIWVSTAFFIDFMAWYAGVPSPPSHVSTVYPMTNVQKFRDRFTNSIIHAVIMLITKFYVIPKFETQIQKHYGSKFPSLETLLTQTEMYFINADPVFEDPRPVAHNVIYVGGMTMDEPGTLPQQWQKLLERKEAKEHGVIVFSLGTVANTSTMPQHIKNSFLAAFKKRKELVIWRFEGEFAAAKTVLNVYLTPWIPQKELLGHSSVRAFITHGGYNSLTEATYMGVPLVVLPLFGDQPVNAHKVQGRGVGVVLSLNNLNQESISRALEAVLDKPEVAQKSRRLSRMIREKPKNAREMAIKWTEYLAEFKTLREFLGPGGQDLNLAKYYLLDVLFVIFVVCFAIGFVLKRSCICLCTVCCKTKTETN